MYLYEPSKICFKLWDGIGGAEKGYYHVFPYTYFTK